MTVGELIATLAELDPALPVEVSDQSWESEWEPAGRVTVEPTYQREGGRLVCRIGP
jgi:hypothetical protein